MATGRDLHGRGSHKRLDLEYTLDVEAECSTARYERRRSSRVELEGFLPKDSISPRSQSHPLFDFPTYRCYF